MIALMPGLPGNPISARWDSLPFEERKSVQQEASKHDDRVGPRDELPKAAG